RAHVTPGAPDCPVRRAPASMTYSDDRYRCENVAAQVEPRVDGQRREEPVPRLREVPRHEAVEDVVLSSYQRMFGDRDPVAEPGTASGTPGNWWTVFALVPDVLRHAVSGFRLYQSPTRLLPPQLRELGQTRAGWVIGSQFVFSQHCKSCRAVG